MNKFKNSNTNKRYYTFSHYLKNKYSSKVAKLAIDGGFTCPNRDGTLSTGGCSFCSESGSGEFTVGSTTPIKEQIVLQKEVQKRKWPNAKFIAYFQNYTNTYDSLNNLKHRFEQVLEFDDIVGIAIGTRPDCLDDEKIAYLSSLTSKTDVWIEIGLQTIHEDTFNRKYQLSVYDEVMRKLSKTSINTCVHIINGLPEETTEDMIDTAKYVSNSGPTAIKIHSLFINTNTAWSDKYLSGNIKLLEKEQYINVVVQQLRHVNENIIIQRVTGDPDKESFLGPHWAINKRTVINDIDKLMARENYYQGDKLKAG